MLEGWAAWDLLDFAGCHWHMRFTFPRMQHPMLSLVRSYHAGSLGFAFFLLLQPSRSNVLYTHSRLDECK